MKKHVVIAIVTLIILACSFFGAGETEKLSDGEATLRMYSGMELASADPGVIWADEPGGSCIPLLFSNLTETDQEGGLAPGMAESWETSPDGTRWTFHLREDVSWVSRNQDTGKVEAVRPVTSSDFVFALRRKFQALSSPIWEWEHIYIWSSYVSTIKGGKEFLSGSGSLDQLGVRAVDDQTLEIELVFPVDNFPLGRLIYAIPEELVEQYGERWTEPENIWTSGPYLMESWEHDNKLILMKNPLYPNAAENPTERIEVVYGISPEQALEMYKNGELDILRVRPEDLEGIQQDPQLNQQLHYGPRVRAVGLLFNTAKPPFNNRHLLQAFEYAINREGIIQAGRGDKSFNDTACSLSPASAGETWNVADWDLVQSYNPEVAKLELELSGYDEDVSPWALHYDLELAVQAGAEMQSVANSLQAGWEKDLELTAKKIICAEYAACIPLYYYTAAMMGDAAAKEKLASLDAPNIALMESIVLYGSYFDWGSTRSATGQVEMFPLYSTYMDPFLLSAHEMQWQIVDSFIYFMFPGYQPASEISCPSIPQPSAEELAEQCMEVVMEAKEAAEKHDCETWVPKAEDALRLATEALSIDRNNAKAFYCRGLAHYYLERQSQSLSDLERAQELGGSGYESQLEMWIPYVRELVEAPACTISPLQFFEGWQNGKPLNPSAEYSGKDPYTIQVYWELKGSCDTVCRVVWKKDDIMICSHDYGGENPHERYEGSLYSNDDSSPLAGGVWSVEVYCGNTLVGQAEAVIP